MPATLSPASTAGMAKTASTFLTVGAVSTLIEIAVFNLALTALGASPVVAKVVASLVALINAYLGNRHLTFRDRTTDAPGRQLGRFLVANGVCTGLGAAIVWAAAAVLTSGAGQGPSVVALNAVNLGSIALIIVLRFVLYHRWVFRHAPARTP
jgi:putative flippase GtrA